MRKIIVLLAVIAALFTSCVKEGPSSQEITAEAQEVNSMCAVMSIPVPTLSYFQERRTVEKWARFWDKPNLPTYVYVFMFDRCIGYFVSDGKPASTQSYLQPETQFVSRKLVGTYYVEQQQAPDLDGTYGNNNPGIRFFTADGNPVEVGGSGVSYIYSAYPLNLSDIKLVPRM